MSDKWRDRPQPLQTKGLTHRETSALRHTPTTSKQVREEQGVGHPASRGARTRQGGSAHL